jgi:CheY-like chemotaxis protein/anti-sigma regulatory factor (Ser/Thr protein kinase)
LDVTDLNEVIGSSLEFIKPRLDEQCQTTDSGIEVMLNLNEIGLIEGSETEIREALINILINAIEAMPQGGRLSIETKQDGEFVVVSISDTGVGMTSDVQRRVFDPFFTTKGLRGLGMGLSIVRSTIERHQGQITVTSEHQKGSAFTLRIPVTKKQKWKEELVESRRNDTNDANILVVDDDKGPRDILYEILTKAGYDVDIANGGKEGLSLIKQKVYNLILADLGMPEVSGWDLASETRRSSSETLVVLVTGWGVQIDTTKLKERGIHNVITKPFSRESVLAIVSAALGDRRRSNQSNN